MEERIIKVTPATENNQCLICGNREKKATFKLSIQRPKYEDSITSFHVCNQCLAKMQNDIQKTYE